MQFNFILLCICRTFTSQRTESTYTESWLRQMIQYVYSLNEQLINKDCHFDCEIIKERGGGGAEA